MNKARRIWKNENDRAKEIARRLMETDRLHLRWKTVFLPSALFDFLRMRWHLRLTRKNLLFTQSLAFEAAEAVLKGKDPSVAFRDIEIRTQTVLDRDKKGFYTEKIRRKQLLEIQCLMDHYLGLLKADGGTYADLVKAVYPDKKAFRRFLDRLHAAEQAVIQASVTSLRKESKKGRRNWFADVLRLTAAVRVEEAERIYDDD